MKLAGFQLTARFKDGGSQAGTLAPGPGEEARIGIDVQEDVQYANQRRKGAVLSAPDTATWSLLWSAPAPVGPVMFHVAANAADADERAEGDYIHTAVVDVVPDRNLIRIREDAPPGGNGGNPAVACRSRCDEHPHHNHALPFDSNQRAAALINPPWERPGACRLARSGRDVEQLLHLVQ
jgi:hypothetical protein